MNNQLQQELPIFSLSADQWHMHELQNVSTDFTGPQNSFSIVAGATNHQTQDLSQLTQFSRKEVARKTS